MAIAARSPFPVFEAIAALLVVAGFATVAYLQMQAQISAVPQFDTQSTYDAKPGGYRAVYEVLGREGVRVQQFERHPAYLDGSIDVFVVSDAEVGPSLTIPLQQADIDAIGAWVKAGGSLLVIGHAYRGDPALKMAAIARTGGPNDRARPIISSALTDGVRSVDGTSTNRIPFAGAQRQIPAVADTAGAVVATYSLGKGSVIVVSDPTLFQNRNLARADNARLAYDLVTANAGPRGVVAFEEFSHGHQVAETFLSVLPVPARVGLAIVGIALLALLVATFFRFGPVVPQSDDSERTSAEYLSSMAALLARGGATRKALRDVADAAIHGLAESLGLHDSAPVALLAARLRGRSAGDAAADALLELNRLRSYEYPKEADLLAAARIASVLRKEYAPNARIGFGRRRTSAKRSA
ncbi:MAG TPA: DUF4350 domain-containing protein [Candidatus Eremiobacteraceae bacterium]